MKFLRRATNCTIGSSDSHTFGIHRDVSTEGVHAFQPCQCLPGVGHRLSSIRRHEGDSVRRGKQRQDQFGDSQWAIIGQFLYNTDRGSTLSRGSTVGNSEGGKSGRHCPTPQANWLGRYGELLCSVVIPTDYFYSEINKIIWDHFTSIFLIV